MAQHGKGYTKMKYKTILPAILMLLIIGIAVADIYSNIKERDNKDNPQLSADTIQKLYEKGYGVTYYVFDTSTTHRTLKFETGRVIPCSRTRTAVFQTIGNKKIYQGEVYAETWKQAEKRCIENKVNSVPVIKKPDEKVVLR